MLVVINVALRRRIGGVAGLANSEHIYMRACSVTEVTTCAKHKTVCKANSGSSCMFL